jgi:hypothetical protein
VLCNLLNLSDGVETRSQTCCTLTAYNTVCRSILYFTTLSVWGILFFLHLLSRAAGCLNLQAELQLKSKSTASSRAYPSSSFLFHYQRSRHGTGKILALPDWQISTAHIKVALRILPLASSSEQRTTGGDCLKKLTFQ